jgi:hypothetical protein
MIFRVADRQCLVRSLPRPFGFARKDAFVEPDQSDLPCPVPFRKIFRFLRRANHLYKLARPAPHRGAFRDRHGRRVRDAVDAAALGVEIDRRAGFGP